MFPTVLLIVILTALIAVGTFLFMVATVVWQGPRAEPHVQREWRWRPPLAHVDELKSWAAETAESITRKWLTKGRTSSTLKELLAELLHGATFAINHVPHVGLDINDPDCGSGRHEMIGVTAPEALAIADQIRGNRREALRVHNLATANAKSSAPMSRTDYATAQFMCPLFTADGKCAAFPLRPLQCRATCELCRGENDGHVPADRTSLAEVAQSVGMGAELGLARGIAAAGLDAKTYELNSALAVALDTRDASNRWARGEDVFADCKQCV